MSRSSNMSPKAVLEMETYLNFFTFWRHIWTFQQIRCRFAIATGCNIPIASSFYIPSTAWEIKNEQFEQVWISGCVYFWRNSLQMKLLCIHTILFVRKSDFFVVTFLVPIVASAAVNTKPSLQANIVLFVHPHEFIWLLISWNTCVCSRLCKFWRHEASSPKSVAHTSLFFSAPVLVFRLDMDSSPPDFSPDTVFNLHPVITFRNINFFLLIYPYFVKLC